MYKTEQFNQNFLFFIEGLLAKKEVVIFGDMNVAHKPIDLALPKQNEGKAGFTWEERESFTNLLKLGFKDSFRELYPD